LLKNIGTTIKFASGVTLLPLQNLNGSGLPQKEFGTNGMMINSITGAHRKKDSLMLDGPGIRDTGITVATYIGMYTTSGIDLRLESGSTMPSVFQSSQKFHEARRFADHSCSSKSSDSRHHYPKKNYRDVKLARAKRPSSTCGLTELLVTSSEEN